MKIKSATKRNALSIASYLIGVGCIVLVRAEAVGYSIQVVMVTQ